MAFVQAGPGNWANNGSTASDTFPSTPTPDSLLLAYVGSQHETLPVALTAGWNALTGVFSATGGSTNRSGRMFWKKAGASEPTLHQFTVGGNVRWTCHVLELSEVSSSTPLLVENAQLTASSANHATPNVDPTDGVRALVFTAFGMRATGTWSGQTVNDSATGVTERTDVTTDDTSGADLCGCTATLEVASTASGNYHGDGTCSSTQVGTAHIAIFQMDALVTTKLVPWIQDD